MEKWQGMITHFLGLLSDNLLLQALLILLASLLVAWILDRIVIASLAGIIRKVSATFDTQILQLIRRPIFKTVILLGLASATAALSLEESWKQAIFSILITFALIFWTAFFIRLTSLLLTQMAANPTRHHWLHFKTLPLFENIAYILIIGISVYYIFSAWKVDMTAWLASAGIVGIAVGFAAKDTLANLFSGVFILADAPYKIGDFVVLDGGERGEITKIGLRSTRLLTRDDIEVTVPNSVMGNSKIINESGGPHEKSRVRVKVGVGYGSDIDLVREILLQVAQSLDDVCKDPEPRVRLRQFGPSGLDFELLCWICQPVLRGRILDRLNCAVYKEFRAQGVEIPYAKQDVYIKEIPKQRNDD